MHQHGPAGSVGGLVPGLERRARGALLVAALVAAASLLPTASTATVPALFGMGPRPMAVGGAYAAVAQDLYGIYYNPAGVAYLPGNTATIGLIRAQMDLDPLSGGVIGADANGDAITGTIDSRVDDQTSVLLSMGFPMEFLKRPAGGGILALMPVGNAFSLASRSGLEPGYARYRHVLDIMFVYFGGGVEIVPGLAVGFGTQMFFASNGDIDFTLDIGGDPATGELSLAAPWRFAPVAGVRWEPLDGWTIGASYRGESSADFEEFHVDPTGDVSDLGTFGFEVNLFNVNVFTPQQATLGVAYQPDDRWTFSLDVTWSDWSRYQDSSLFVVVDGHLQIGPLPPGDLGFPATVFFETRARDTWTPRVGAERWLDDVTFLDDRVRIRPALRAGFFFDPSPIEDQPGATNLADPDRYVWSIGLGLEVPKPLDSDKTFSVDLAFQHSILAERETRKDREFEDLDGDGVAEARVLGYPGYTAAGSIYTLTGTLSFSF